MIHTFLYFYTLFYLLCCHCYVSTEVCSILGVPPQHSAENFNTTSHSQMILTIFSMVSMMSFKQALTGKHFINRNKQYVYSSSYNRTVFYILCHFTLHKCFWPNSLRSFFPSKQWPYPHYPVRLCNSHKITCHYHIT